MMPHRRFVSRLLLSCLAWAATARAALGLDYISPPDSALVISGAVGKEVTDDGVATGLGVGPSASNLFTGSYTTSIPIQLPPNRGGRDPVVQLAYRSGNGDGFLGMGWTLDLGSVERSTKGGIRYGGGDYVFQGSALVFDAATGRYRPVIESDFKLIQKLTNATENRPYWLVTDKTGTKYRYGYTAASRLANPNDSSQIFRWCLDQVVDANGNGYSVSYYKDPVGSDLYPETITYAGNVVKFWRDAGAGVAGGRVDAPVSYALKFGVTTAYRLKTIEVRSVAAGGTTRLARAYVLTYALSAGTRRSVLASVTQYGSDATIDATGTVAAGPTPPLPAETFSYTEPPAGFRADSASLQPPVTATSTPDPDYLQPPTDPVDVTWTLRNGGLLVDLDGDARPDLIQGVRVQGHYPAGDADLARAWLNRGTGVVLSAAYSPPSTIANVDYGAGSDMGVRVADLNGDGLPDLVQGFTDGVNTLRMAWLNNGGSCSTAACAWTPAPGLAPPVAFAQGDVVHRTSWDTGARLVDLNGDGTADVVYGYSTTNPTYVSGTGWRDLATTACQYPIVGTCGVSRVVNGVVWYDSAGAFLNGGTGWTAAPAFTPPASFALRDAASMGKDGMPSGFDAGLRLVDLDGDRKLDLVQGVSWGDAAATVSLSAWINGGAAWSYSSGWAPPAGFYFVGRDLVKAPRGWDNGVRLVDVNGDGRTDLMRGFTDAMTVSTDHRATRLNTASGWTASDAAGYAPPFSFTARNASYPGGYDLGVRMADVNGDGRLDAVRSFYWRNLSGAICSQTYTLSADTWLFDGSAGTGSKWVSAPAERSPAGFAEGMTTTASNCTGGGASTQYYGPTGGGALDLDGDGIADAFGGMAASYWTSGVYRNLGEAPDLLRERANGFGGRTTVEYAPSTRFPNHRMPFPLWVVKSVTKDDATVEPSTTTLDYAGAYFQPADQEFRGFAYAAATGPAGADGDQLETRYWFHQGNTVAAGTDNRSGATGYAKGKPYRLELWDLKKQSFSRSTIEYWDSVGPSYFTPTRQIETVSCDFETGVESCGSPVRTEYAGFSGTTAIRAYDTWGNTLRENHYGDVTDATDDVTIVRTYDTTSSANVVGAVASEAVYAGAGPATSIAMANQLAKTTYYYDGPTPPPTTCVPATEPTQSPTRGNLTKVVRWLNGGTDVVLRAGLDAYGNQICARDADGRVTAWAYDPSGTFPLTATNAKLHVTTAQYYGVNGVAQDKGQYGQLKLVTDPNGLQQQYEYDAFGRETNRIAPAVTAPLAGASFPGYSVATTYTLTANPRVESTSSTGEYVVRYLDGLGRVRAKAERGGTGGRLIGATTVFDAAGRALEVTRPAVDFLNSPKRTRRLHDALGRTVKTTRPDGTVTLACHRDVDRSSVTIDENGHRRRVVRDARGNVAKVQEYKGTYSTCTTEEGTPYATTRYAYDRLSRLTTVTDAASSAGTVFSTDYDTLGRRMYVSDPDLGTWTFGHFPSGDLQWQRDANGAGATTPYSIYFSYDELHRRTLTDKPSGVDTVMVYDDPAVPYSKGRLTSMTDASGTTSWGYDAGNRPFSATRMIDGVTYKTTVGYDAAGRMETTSYVYPGSSPTNQIKYDYDVDGLLWKVGVDGVTLATLTGYDTFGRPGSVALKNGVTTTYRSEARSDRLSLIDTVGPTGVRLVNLSYTYDGEGNVSTLVDGVDRLRSQGFAYDELDRMVWASSWALKESSVTYNYADPLRVHAVTSTSTGASFAYDLNGNMTADGTRTIEYDVTNRPSAINVGGNRIVLGYDGAGNRVKKQLVTGTGTTTTVYPDDGVSCTNGACTRHVFAGGARIASIDAAGATSYFHADHLGSIRAVTNAAGAVLEGMLYQPFGAEASTGSTKFRFTGQEFDHESGLHFYGGRYYNAALRRFISPDPIGVNPFAPQSLNRYAYVHNNPVNYTDPTGYTAAILSAGDFGLMPAGGGTTGGYTPYDPVPEGPYSGDPAVQDFGETIVTEVVQDFSDSICDAILPGTPCSGGGGGGGGASYEAPLYTPGSVASEGPQHQWETVQANMTPIYQGAQSVGAVTSTADQVVSGIDIAVTRAIGPSKHVSMQSLRTLGAVAKGADLLIDGVRLADPKSDMTVTRFGLKLGVEALAIGGVIGPEGALTYGLVDGSYPGGVPGLANDTAHAPVNFASGSWSAMSFFGMNPFRLWLQ